MTSDTKHTTELLKRVIDRPSCILSYDRDLVTVLPDILRERHNITRAENIPSRGVVTELFASVFGNDRSRWNLAELPKAVAEAGILLEGFSCRAASATIEDEATRFEEFSTEDVENNRDAVLQLQKDLGMGRTKTASAPRYSPRLEIKDLSTYLASVTTPNPSWIEKFAKRSFWEIMIRRWIRAGYVDPQKPTFSIGPRWVTEIEFFRQIVGLKKHVGLDLFSDEEEMVFAGDMHAMPFPDNHFGLAFLKNVVDKSYDVRKLVDELIRVLVPGGIIIVDQICAYGECTPLTRTDIQCAGNLLAVIRARTPVKVLVNRDIDISGIGDAAAKNEKRTNARLAVRILKSDS